MKKNITFLFCSFLFFANLNAQVDPLIERVNNKLSQVDDYVAEGIMKTNVSFIKASLGKVKVYFKKPHFFTIKKESGISLLPKGGISMTLGSIVNIKNYTSFHAGNEVLNGKTLAVVKIIPNDANIDWVLSTLWIDPVEALVYKTMTTTKDNGSYEIAMQYGAYAKYGLASKIVFSFNTKNYKLPNGITLEFGDDNMTEKTSKIKTNKGSIEISYSNYLINKGLPSKI